MAIFSCRAYPPDQVGVTGKKNGSSKKKKQITINVQGHRGPRASIVCSLVTKHTKDEMSIKPFGQMTYLLCFVFFFSFLLQLIVFYCLLHEMPDNFRIREQCIETNWHDSTFVSHFSTHTHMLYAAAIIYIAFKEHLSCSPSFLFFMFHFVARPCK